MKKLIVIIIIILGIVDFWCYSYRRPDFAQKILSIDYILVEKGKRRMSIYNNGKVIKEYKIVLGLEPQGHKHQEGDNKTPEGIYYIAFKNPRSSYHLSLKISYPNQSDVQHAISEGVSPGDHIMIHGIGYWGRLKWLKDYYSHKDWTAGCIALSNEEIEEIYASTQIGTKVEIKP